MTTKQMKEAPPAEGASSAVVEHGFIHCRSFNRAAQFLRALSPLASTWQSDPSDWVFRGHGDSRWRLLPSCCRRACWQPFATVPSFTGQDGSEIQPFDVF